MTRIAAARSRASHALIERLDDRPFAAEENAGVLGLERAQARIGRPLRIVRRRPGKEAGIEPRREQAEPQAPPSLVAECDLDRLRRVRQHDGKVSFFTVTSNADELPLPGHDRGQFVERNVFEQDAEQTFAKMPAKLNRRGTIPNPAGASDQENHRFAAARRLAQRFFPELAGLDTAFGIEVEKNIVPSFLSSQRQIAIASALFSLND